MFEEVLFSLLTNSILLLSLGVMYELLPLKSRNHTLWMRLLSGFIIGLIGIAVMSTPWSLKPGVNIDARSTLLSISGLFFSPLSTLIAMVITGLFRTYLGGAGMPAGVGIVVTAAASGLLWRKFRPKFKTNPYTNLEMYIFSMFVTLVMLLCIWLLLPPPEGPELLRAISIPILIMYPIEGVLLGNLLRHQRSRKEINLKVQENEENLRKILENMPIMLDAFDEHNNIILWNKECELVTGYTAKEIVNNPDALTLLYPDPPHLQKVLQKYDDPNSEFKEIEFTLTAKDGTPRTIAWSTASAEIPIPGWHYWAAGIDLTQRKRAEEKIHQLNSELEQKVIERTAQLQSTNKALEKALQSRDSFLANMSHELRTPLTAILGMSEILGEQIRGPLNDVQLKYVRSINHSGTHLLQLINDVLDLSKLEAQQITLNLQDVSLQELCESSLNFIYHQAETKHLQIELSINTQHTHIHADARRMKQILINLMSNAVKFTPEGGKLGLQVIDNAEKADWVQIIVWDNGIGISPENQKILFQPFVQLDSKLSRRYDGTGLGLVLVSRFVELHNGQVELKSEPGHGTRITVHLPYSQNPA